MVVGGWGHGLVSDRVLFPDQPLVTDKDVDPPGDTKGTYGGMRWELKTFGTLRG